MSNFPLVTAPKTHAAEAQSAYADHSNPNVDSAVQFSIDIDLEDIIQGDIETLNDLVENRLFTEGGVLTDAMYTLADKNPGGGSVRLNVTASIVLY